MISQSAENEKKYHINTTNSLDITNTIDMNDSTYTTNINQEQKIGRAHV